MSGLLSQVGSKYREELKKNLCIFGKSRGNNSGKRELVQNLHRFNTCVYVEQLVQKMHRLGDFWGGMVKMSGMEKGRGLC